MQKNNLQISKDAKELLRKLAVKLIFKDHIQKWKVKELLAVSWTFITQCCKKYNLQWEKWIEKSSKIWWRPREENNNLTPQEFKKLEKILWCEPRAHRQLHLDFGLWNIEMVQHVIDKLFSKKIKTRKAREILIELWFTNQKPLFRAYQQNPEKVIERVETILPLIKDEAEKEDREVMYWDEAGFRSTDHKWKTWAKKWKTPMVRVTWSRFWINAISCIWPKWKLRFMAYEWTFNSDKLTEFLKRLTYRSNKKLTLILDWHPSHKTAKIRLYLQSINDQIKIYYLPWYSPELNPDEQVWNQVENDLKGQIIASKQQMINQVKRSLYRLQKEKSKVMSYFRHPDVQWYPTK